MIAPRQSRLVAVVGGSGSGKTWLATRICTLLGDKACHLALDDFYLDRSHLAPEQRVRLNFDVPQAIDWPSAERALLACRTGRPVQLPRYDFASHCRVMERAWEPRPIVVVDGLWLLRRPELRPLFDLKLFLETPGALRRSRRLARDMAERGYARADVVRRFDDDVAPMHERYVAPQKKWADLVLEQPFVAPQVHELARRVWTLLEQAAPMPPWMHETFRAELTELLLPHECRR